MENKSIIITGGAGFIGSHIADSLVARGDEVVVIDDLSAGKSEFIKPKAKFVKHDLTDEHIPAEVNAEGSIIFHMAAKPDVRASMEKVAEHHDVDMKTTLNILEAARKQDASAVVFASSSVVYGAAEQIPTPEDAPISPISFYGLFKAQCEIMMEFYAMNYGIRTVSIRLANVIGKRSDHGVIPDFIRKLKDDSSRLEILGDGKQKKSYVHISDVVTAFVLAGDSSKKGHTAYNIGTDSLINVDEIAKIIEGEMGIAPRHEYKNNLNGKGWKGDITTMLLDTSKARTGLGWNPKTDCASAVKLAAREVLEGYK